MKIHRRVRMDNPFIFLLHRQLQLLKLIIKYDRKIIFVCYLKRDIQYRLNTFHFHLRLNRVYGKKKKEKQVPIILPCPLKENCKVLA